MRIPGRERCSQLWRCLAAARMFLLTDERALSIMKHQAAGITAKRDVVCAEAQIS